MHYGFLEPSSPYRHHHRTIAHHRLCASFLFCLFLLILRTCICVSVCVSLATTGLFIGCFILMARGVWCKSEFRLFFFVCCLKTSLSKVMALKVEWGNRVWLNSVEFIRIQPFQSAPENVFNFFYVSRWGNLVTIPYRSLEFYRIIWGDDDEKEIKSTIRKDFN